MPDGKQGDQRQQGGLDGEGQEGQARYRAVSMLAATSVGVGALSFLVFFSWFLALIPVLAIAMAVVALRQIKERPAELTGGGLAQVGIGLSLVLGMLGGGFLAYGQLSEVPEGYKSITFESLQGDPAVRGEVVPPAAYELVDRDVFIKGYIYPGRRTLGIRRFILVPTRGHCSFCTRKLKSTEMIRVTLVGDLRTDFKTHMTHVGGRLKIDSAQAGIRFGGMPYQIEADYVR
jgi:hypothetical protein